MLASQPLASVPLSTLSGEPAEATAWMKEGGIIGYVPNPLGMSLRGDRPLGLAESYIQPKN